MKTSNCLSKTLAVITLLSVFCSISGQIHNPRQTEINRRTDSLSINNRLDSMQVTLKEYVEFNLKALRGIKSQIEEIISLYEKIEANVNNPSLNRWWQSHNPQYLQFQKDFQAENRQYNLVSNVLKVKHETAKSTINNVK
ncbi:MAG: hypothetical protein JXB49_20140 [Bacteroidales bacterium]|nr:hypothetical protein [Bacteroidales bacterium]